jgi:hypothetical protein
MINHDSLNKVGILIFFKMNIIKSSNAKDNTALEQTLENYEKLVRLIIEKILKKD